jgi:hypothetical protein
MRHLYIANPPENALHQMDSYGRGLGYGTSARLVLLHCLQEAWDDGHARMTPTGVAAAVGLSFDATNSALRELAENGEIELQQTSAGSFIVRPVFLASDSGTQAGVGWWQRLELEDEV